MAIRARDLDKRVLVQRPGDADDDDINSAGARGWADVDTLWAKVQDLRPRLTETTQGGVTIAVRRAMVTLRIRPDITASMRIVFGARVMQIIDGPAVLDGNEFFEMLCEDYSTEGEPA